MNDFSYENTRRVVYGDGATFIPICENCGRYVKADESVFLNRGDGQPQTVPNATCKKCGRVQMVFEGYY